jgi:hypothetical protein
VSDEINFGQKLILTVLGGLGVGGASVLTWLASRGKIKIEKGSAVVTQYETLVRDLQEERDAMHKERLAFGQERRDWIMERADMRRRMLSCEGQQRGMEQYLYSLESLLRGAGLDIPEKRRVVPIIMLETEIDNHGFEDLNDGG